MWGRRPRGGEVLLGHVITVSTIELCRVWEAVVGLIIVLITFNVADLDFVNRHTDNGLDLEEDINIV